MIHLKTYLSHCIPKNKITIFIAFIFIYIWKEHVWVILHLFLFSLYMKNMFGPYCIPKNKIQICISFICIFLIYVGKKILGHIFFYIFFLFISKNIFGSYWIPKNFIQIFISFIFILLYLCIFFRVQYDPEICFH